MKAINKQMHIWTHPHIYTQDGCKGRMDLCMVVLPLAFDLIIQITFMNTCLHMHPKGPQPEICFLVLRGFQVGLFVIQWDQS